ncbi:RT0821/Lpp0805 family surface protein [Mesorhizobium sp. 1M-11]|uniref:RT0821/Lpp0805 family surface protein n=1 Tax=Mesorhizobium sp. 1M-11 TaxID=1529006 RepID=UPI0006C73EF2|nr:RT0821/Lpp0805 family surface protein [Mesorhizobium sp. 1M-11]
MSRIAHRFDSRPVGTFVSSCLRAAAPCVLLVLAGCGAGGFSLEKAEVDRSIVTGSISSGASNNTDAGMASDETTIRNAASSADLQGLANQAVPWANSATGSRGAITALAETGDTIRGRCRQFDVSRESYDGVTMYKGSICMTPTGAWKTQDFKAL